MCEATPPGYYSSAGMAKPSRCGAASFFCRGNGSATPSVVQKGYISVPVQTEPDARIGEEPCPAGAWCSAGIAVPCERSYYAQMSLPLEMRTDASACRQCPKFSVSEEASTSIEQCQCMAGYYDNETSSGKVSCQPCTAGTDGCVANGTTTVTLNISAGWYRTSSLSVDLRRCPDGSNKDSGCVGGIGDEGPCKPCAASLVL